MKAPGLPSGIELDSEPCNAASRVVSSCLGGRFFNDSFDLFNMILQFFS